MASQFFKRLKDKYGKDNITGKKYQKIIDDILTHNSERTSTAIFRMSDSHYKTSIKKLSKEKLKTVKLPDVSEVLPKRSVFLIKGAEKGKMISDTLRTDIQKKLRKTIEEFQKTGKSKMEIQRGKTTGKINPKLIQKFQESLVDTFKPYTKKDKITGVPGNIRNIAVTEIRSTVGMIKEKYNDELLRRNPQMKMYKTWLHNRKLSNNRKLSKKPRETHIRMHGVTIPVNKKFKVDREDGSGYDMMSRPHDIDAPPEQTIGCSCDTVYKAIL